MRKLIGLLAVLVLIAAACGGDDDTTAAADDSNQSSDDGSSDDDGGDNSGDDDGDNNSGDDDGDDSSDDSVEPPSGGDSAALCELGERFEDDNPLEGVTLFDGEDFFNRVDALWSDVRDVAPSQVSGDVDEIAGAFGRMRDLFEEYDFNLLDEGLQVGLEEFDSDALDAAGNRLEAYIEQECDLSLDLGADTSDSETPTVPGFDPEDIEDLQDQIESGELDEAAAALMALFGIDEELAKCLNDELGGLDPENIDPSTFNDPICGTTLLEIVSGIGQG